MYCFGGNHRYSLFEDLWETLGATFGAILGATFDANFVRKNFNFFFWNSNPGQIDDFHLMRLFCLSIYIRNITYWTTVIQSIEKNEKSPFCSSKNTACCLCEGIQLNLQPCPRYQPYCPVLILTTKLADPLVFSVVVVVLFEPKQRSPCWVFTT